VVPPGLRFLRNLAADALVSLEHLMGTTKVPYAAALLMLVFPGTAASEDSAPPPLTIARARGPIAVDGDLSDEGWKGAARIDTWFETRPADNVPPKVRSIGLLAYDDRFFYAGFEFEDPEPQRIRAPYGDRDNVPSYTDYGGVILDTRNDGKTGILFLANPRGIQYDAVSDDTNGNEDSSPDFYWDSAARINPRGWTLEIRIPFSSLRYPKADPRTWGIMLYRNYPRDFRYQLFSTSLPRGGSCFICRSNKLSGLVGLPSGGHLVLAPYLSGSQTAQPRDGLGTPLDAHHLDGDAGLDVKWTPGASTAIDLTANPDFSQIESDVAQIAANERFALFFPEKRPFFLEGVELLSTPIQAVYTRTITSPRWGVRGTGKSGRTAYTGLVAEDEGGGSVVIPSSNSSDLADQDFRSWVATGRVRRDLGRSFVSALFTGRTIEGGGYNHVFGPDFQWRPSARDTMTGQLLLSRSRTPARPDLAAEWDGRRLASHAGDLWWNHSTTHVDWFTEYRDFGDEFRADNGFIPQTGYRSGYGETGYTFRPQGLLRRLRTFLIANRAQDRGGSLLSRQFSVGSGMDARWNTFFRVRVAFDRVRTGDLVLPRRQLIYTLQTSPSRWLSQISLDGFVGEEIDFDNHRKGKGANVSLQATLRPSNHLELRLDESRRLLNVPTASGSSARLFTAEVNRLRATYTFTSRMFLRVIGQYVETRRDPRLYLSEVARKSGSFAASALFAYKLNWQTVLFLGYGDDRTLSETEHLEREDRQIFAKLSYAFQR
jgi:Domain of unknown function (DUF5916)